MYFTERAHTHAHTPYILQKAHAHHIFYRRGDNAQHIPMRTCAHTHRSHQSQIQRAKCVRLTFFNHCCVSGYFNHCCVSCAAVREHTHTHTIFRERERAHTIYFTGEETLHKTFLGAHTHRSHQSQIQHATCVRLTFFNHCCVSSAAAQKQGICKCQGMVSLLAQRSMIRAT